MAQEIRKAQAIQSTVEFFPVFFARTKTCVYCYYRTIFAIPAAYSTLGWIKVCFSANNRKTTSSSTTGCDTNAFVCPKCTHMIQSRGTQCPTLIQVDLLQMFNYGLSNPPPQGHGSTMGWIVWELSCNKLVLIEKLSNLSNVSVMIEKILNLDIFSAGAST